MEKILYAANGEVFRTEKEAASAAEERRCTYYYVYFSDNEDLLFRILLRCGAEFCAPAGTDVTKARINGKEIFFTPEGRNLEAIDCIGSMPTYKMDTKMNYEDFLDLIY